MRTGGGGGGQAEAARGLPERQEWQAVTGQPGGAGADQAAGAAAIVPVPVRPRVSLHAGVHNIQAPRDLLA